MLGAYDGQLSILIPFNNATIIIYCVMIIFPSLKIYDYVYIFSPRQVK